MTCVTLSEPTLEVKVVVDRWRLLYITADPKPLLKAIQRIIDYLLIMDIF